MTDLGAAEALQATLAGEHAAVYVLAFVGGRVSRSAEPTLASAVQAAYDVHLARRDRLSGTLVDLGEEPVAAATAYELPGPATTPGQLRARAAQVERRTAALYAQLVAASSGPVREQAVDALADAAVRVLGFGGRATSLPGLDA